VLDLRVLADDGRVVDRSCAGIRRADEYRLSDVGEAVGSRVVHDSLKKLVQVQSLYVQAGRGLEAFKSGSKLSVELVYKALEQGRRRSRGSLEPRITEQRRNRDVRQVGNQEVLGPQVSQLPKS